MHDVRMSAGRRLPVTDDAAAVDVDQPTSLEAVAGTRALQSDVLFAAGLVTVVPDPAPTEGGVFDARSILALDEGSQGIHPADGVVVHGVARNDLSRHLGVLPGQRSRTRGVERQGRRESEV